MNYKSRTEEPPTNTRLIAYCPDWDDLEYQICYYNKKYGFYYPNQPNEMFDENVISWKLLDEAICFIIGEALPYFPQDSGILGQPMMCKHKED